MAIALVPYGFYAIIQITGATVNEIKWNQAASNDYTLTFCNVFLGPPEFCPEVVVVKAGQVQSRDFPHCRQPDCIPPHEPPTTIAGLFGIARTCWLFFPLVTCSAEYDAQYGYPKTISLDCWWMPDLCSHTLAVVTLDLKP